MSTMKLKGPLLLIFALTTKWLDLVTRKGISTDLAFSEALLPMHVANAKNITIHAWRIKFIERVLSSNYLIGE